MDNVLKDKIAQHIRAADIDTFKAEILVNAVLGAVEDELLEFVMPYQHCPVSMHASDMTLLRAASIVRNAEQ